MSRDDVKGWINTFWPIVVAVVAVIVSWVTFGSRLSTAETTIQSHDRTLNGTDGEGGIRQKLDRLYTIIDERLPKKGP